MYIHINFPIYVHNFTFICKNINILEHDYLVLLSSLHLFFKHSIKLIGIY
jgi:hypothetical protein